MVIDDDRRRNPVRLQVDPMFGTAVRRIALAVLGAMMFAGVGAPSQAAELLMFESSGCTYCIMWKDQLGGVYSKTSEGKQAPLRRIKISDQKKTAGLLKPVRLTPTFVLMDEGREVGRIQGYGGEEMFWFSLDELLAKLDNKKRHIAEYKAQ